MLPAWKPLAAACAAAMAGAALHPLIVAQATPELLSFVTLAGTLCVVALATLWANRSLSAMRRISLGNELAELFNVNESLDGAMRCLARTLRTSQGADECVIVLHPAHTDAPRLYIDGGGAASSRRLDARVADALLAVPGRRAVLYNEPFWRGGQEQCRAFDAATLEPRSAPAAQLLALANLLEARAFVSVPLSSRTQTLGRVHLLWRRSRCGTAHLRRLARLAAQAGPLIENVHLAERLAQAAASQERKRISRDLHDGTVQPYIGLKLGLEALRRRVGDGEALAGELDELIRMAGEGISQLRHYVGSLSGPGDRTLAREQLLPGLREQVRKFAEYHGVECSLQADGDIPVPARLYEQLIHMVREALSNVRRHTSAARARVSVRRAPGALVIEVANESSPELAPFRPRSIAERAAELGGRVAVGVRPHGETVVAIEIPF